MLLPLVSYHSIGSFWSHTLFWKREWTWGRTVFPSGIISWHTDRHTYGHPLPLVCYSLLLYYISIPVSSFFISIFFLAVLFSYFYFFYLREGVAGWLVGFLFWSCLSFFFLFLSFFLSFSLSFFLSPFSRGSLQIVPSREQNVKLNTQFLRNAWTLCV